MYVYSLFTLYTCCICRKIAAVITQFLHSSQWTFEILCERVQKNAQRWETMSLVLLTE